MPNVYIDSCTVRISLRTIQRKPRAALPSGGAALLCSACGDERPVAALTGYLAFLQLQFSSLTDSRLAEEARNLAVGNGVSAAITVFFAAKLLLGPDRRFLFNSAAWGALSVAWGAYQISQGVTAEVFIAATVAAGLAGMLSLVAAIQRTE
jgi:hypothetical protein